jgi:hypothetical protein
MTDNKVEKATLVAQAAAQAASAVANVEKQMTGTESGTIWSEIKNLPIEMFALPGQFVNMHVQPVLVEPSKLYLVSRASSALPAVETALGKKFVVEAVDKYIVVSRAATPLTHK